MVPCSGRTAHIAMLRERTVPARSRAECVKLQIHPGAEKRANELTELAGKCLRTDKGFAFQLDFEHGQARVYRCRVGPHPHSGRVPRRAVRRPLPLYEHYVRCSPGAVPFHPSFPAQEPTRMPPRSAGVHFGPARSEHGVPLQPSQKPQRQDAQSESPYIRSCRDRARDLQHVPGTRQTVIMFVFGRCQSDT